MKYADSGSFEFWSAWQCHLQPRNDDSHRSRLSLPISPTVISFTLCLTSPTRYVPSTQLPITLSSPALPPPSSAKRSSLVSFLKTCFVDVQIQFQPNLFFSASRKCTSCCIGLKPSLKIAPTEASSQF